ncbi:hypothetical protein [Bartonella rattimassiliensis]|uniref:Uncharacterized protein n=1 Tax=Bartonella rattimassiliensis 15908 TaxID=1094556 RepID=J1JMV9_9HYPH|nr:hypothetical protein [Bartonella rattimassiliensis]EJF86062.1 hypothetical protein MCY_00899 [Bartonella rattimassiliensis 15908]
MSKNRLLCVLIIFIICFSQIIEVRANLSRGRFQQDRFIAIKALEKDVCVQITRRAVMSISGQRSGENSRSLIGLTVEKMISTVVTFFVGKLVFKAVRVFKTWAGAKLSRSFEEWRTSLYH